MYVAHLKKAMTHQSNSKRSSQWFRPVLLACALGASASVLSGCFPLAAGGIVVGAFSISDRRTTGAQAEDQAIELKALSRLRDRFKSDQISFSVTSFNRIALLTGFVPDAQTKAEAARIVAGIENVRSVLNEIELGLPPGIATYGKDTTLTARVKASLMDAKDVQAQAVKVFTEAGSVYLMGIATEREAARAADIASRISGVRRVVRAFEIVSEAELANIQSRNQAEKSAPAAPPQPAAPVTPPPPPPAPAPITPAAPAAIQQPAAPVSSAASAASTGAQPAVPAAAPASTAEATPVR